ncbi:MAG: hypothetical protein Q9M08_05850 [Mariprofundus sp.]|nr:hypothetical protein [Mariprofundus sp.]
MKESTFKRRSWLDQCRVDTEAPKIKLPEHVVRINSGMLDDKLYDLWHLGRDIILAWTPDKTGIELVVVPHYLIAEVVTSHHMEDAMEGHRLDERGMELILTGSKLVSQERIQEISTLFDTTPVRIKLPFIPGKELELPTIDALIKRYSISLVEDRAVALLDSVGFSMLSPFEQVTQLNSLAYSVNSAYSKLLSNDIDIKFARTTTGDGFYIWNRDSSIQGNLNLYHFLHLVLADNAIARSKSSGRAVPYLRACFHVGSHYEFYQAEGLSPTAFSYIVGDVTIVLARMIDQALDGQVLFGQFMAPMINVQSKETEYMDSLDFIKRAQSTIENLHGVELAGDEVESIRCYLTGPCNQDGSYGISKFCLRDKHGQKHEVFNAKINIHRRNARPVFLGLQHNELECFRRKTDEEIIHFSATGTKL